MIGPRRSSVAWSYIREYAAAVISAGLLYWGVVSIVTPLSYPAADGITWFINWIIKTGFRDRTPLGDANRVALRYQLFVVAVGFVSLVLGIFVGLWANIRNNRKPSPKRGLESV